MGLAPRQQGLFGSTAGFCQGRVGADSVYGFLHRECRGLFPDERILSTSRLVRMVGIALVMVTGTLGALVVVDADLVPRQATFALLMSAARLTTLRSRGSVA